MLKLATLCALTLSHLGPNDWPAWRGADGSGVGRGNPPIEWSETKNVRWKAALVGTGISSPIVLGERVYVTSARSTGRKLEGEPVGSERHSPPEVYQTIEEQECLVLAFERASGKELWRTVAAKGMPHQTTHPDGSYATATPVTDGERVYASFGSFGVFALDLAGKVLWRIDLGDMLVYEEFGEGSSPVLCGELLVVNWDHEGDSFLVALDKETGKERWRTPRPKGTSWATPLVVRVGDATEIVVSGVRTIAYDARDGKELWSCGETGAGGGRMMASPVAIDELVLWPLPGRAAGEIRALPALPPEEVGAADPMWRRSVREPAIPSLLAYDGAVYFLSGNSGMLSALDPASGDVLYGPERLSGVADVYASPVAAAGRIYVTGRDGTVEVLSALPEVETLAVNRLDDAFDASPALAGDELFLRGKTTLYCVGEKR